MIAVSAGPILGSVWCQLPGCHRSEGSQLECLRSLRRSWPGLAQQGLSGRAVASSLGPAAAGATQTAFWRRSDIPGVTGWCWVPKGKGRLAGRQLAQAAGREGRVPRSGS